MVDTPWKWMVPGSVPNLPKLPPHIPKYIALVLLWLQRVPVQEYCQIEQLMEQGTLHRTTASTNMNATSSRSHMVITITFKQVPHSIYLSTRLNICFNFKYNDAYILVHMHVTEQPLILRLTLLYSYWVNIKIYSYSWLLGNKCLMMLVRKVWCSYTFEYMWLQTVWSWRKARYGLVYPEITHCYCVAVGIV